MDLKATIPQEVLDQIKGRLVCQAGFGAGPSCCAGKSEDYTPPVPLELALPFLERYFGVMRKGHLRLDDRTILWFEPPQGFLRYDPVPPAVPPSPGVTIRTRGRS